MEISVSIRLDPGDVVTDRRNFPAFEAVRRNQHREIRLAARAWKRRGHVAFLAFRRRHAENQHVLREPTFVTSHHRCNAQRKTFLSEQGISAVTRAVTPDFASLGKVNDLTCFTAFDVSDLLHLRKVTDRR